MADPADSEAAASGTRPLDDVLMAMDVVDTLRHRERIVSRELDSEGREAELIGRLKEIYAAQGIDVPERILRDGVKALEERRFVYEPPKRSLQVALARAYVARDRWLKPVLAGLAAVVVLGLGWQFGYAMPKAQRAQAMQVELNETLPERARRLLAQIEAAATEDGVSELAQAHVRALDAAAQRGNLADARASVAALERLKGDIEAVYVVRVVYGPGEPYSGVFRIPDDVPDARNYYLIVEAVDAAGRPVEVPVSSEEDRRSARVTRWGQRVAESAFERVAADKSDDQIIQAAVIGRKPAGRLRPVWDVATPGGAILEW